MDVDEQPGKINLHDFHNDQIISIHHENRCAVCDLPFGCVSHTITLPMKPNPKNDKKKIAALEDKFTTSPMQCVRCKLLVHDRCTPTTFYCNPFPCIEQKEKVVEKEKENESGSEEKEYELEREEENPQSESVSYDIAPPTRSSAKIDISREVGIDKAFAFLGMQDLMTMRQVCKRWCKFLNEDTTFWEQRGFKYLMPGLGVYLIDSEKNKRNNRLMFPKPIKLQTTIGICGPSSLIDAIIAMWTGNQKPKWLKWHKDGTKLLALRGVLKCRNKLYSFCLQVCTGKSNLRYFRKQKTNIIHGYVIAYPADALNQSPTSPVCKDTMEWFNSFNYFYRSNYTDYGNEVPRIRIAYEEAKNKPNKQNKKDESVLQLDEEERAKISLKELDSTEGDWCVIDEKKQGEESPCEYKVSDNYTAYTALVQILRKIHSAASAKDGHT